jgi:signal transduction histidine kinase
MGQMTGWTRSIKECAMLFTNPIETDIGDESVVLVADVAHELRTPLSVLQGNLWAILNDTYATRSIALTWPPKHRR